jgi:hypothetical protein
MREFNAELATTQWQILLQLGSEEVIFSLRKLTTTHTYSLEY